MADLVTGVETVNDFISLMQKGGDQITNLCQNNDFELVLSTAISSSEAFSDFLQIATDARGILECKRINEVYVGIHHDLICTSIPKTLTWIFATTTASMLSGMLIFLFRGALLPTQHMEGMYEGVFSDENLGRVEAPDDDLSYERPTTSYDKDGISYGDGSVSYDGRSDKI